MAHARSRALFVLIVALLALASLTCWLLPLYVIWPFRHQGATELSVALLVTRIGPAVSLSCAIGCVALLLFFWRRVRWGVRTLGIFALLVAVAGAWLTRINIYELMFHHLDRPQFTAADRARVDSGDMVIAIRVNGERRAYPVREMAYHHVVNDRVGGVPVAATY